MKAWHFVNEDRKLGYDDNRHVRVGRTYKVKGVPVLCERGLHASVRLLEALRYANSSILTRVELGGLIVKGKNKAVATERTVLWMGDISDILHNFACNEAERALKLAEAKNKRSWEATRITELICNDINSVLVVDRVILLVAAMAFKGAAKDAVWSTVRSAQNKRLTAMVLRRMKK